MIIYPVSSYISFSWNRFPINCSFTFGINYIQSSFQNVEAIKLSFISSPRIPFMIKSRENNIQYDNKQKKISIKRIVKTIKEQKSYFIFFYQYTKWKKKNWKLREQLNCGIIHVEIRNYLEEKSWKSCCMKPTWSQRTFLSSPSKDHF